LDFEKVSDADLWKLLETSTGRERGKALIELGFRALRSGDFNAATSYADPAIELFKELDVIDQMSISQYISGSATRAQGQLNQAILLLKSACQGFQESAQENLLGIALRELANAYASSNLIAQAEEAFLSSINILSSIEDTSGVTQVGCEYGEYLGTLGFQSRALEIFLKTKEFAKGLDDPLKVAYIEDRIAACLIELAEGTRALDHLKSALEIVSYAGDKKQIAWALYRYGWTLQTFGYHQEALEILGNAKETFEELNDIADKAKCDFQIAHVYSSLSNFGNANDLYISLKEVFSSLGNEESSYLCEANLAHNLLKAGEVESATHINRSLLEELSNKPYGYIERYSRIQLADCLNQTGFYPEALEQINLIKVEDYGDNQLAMLEYINAKAKTLVFNKLINEGEELLNKIFSSELCKGLEATYAAALETLSTIEHIRGNEIEKLDLRGKAISYYLAGGNLVDARRLADSFSFAPSKSISKVENLTQTTSGFKFGFVP
jgi:tetratricopeptide (TPR) repeat protein